MKNEVTIYVTKYALTQGILTFEPKVGEIVLDKYFKCGGYFIPKKMWFTDREEAQRCAMKMAAKKLISLEKSRKNMETITRVGVSITKGCY